MAGVGEAPQLAAPVLAGIQAILQLLSDDELKALANTTVKRQIVPEDREGLNIHSTPL